MTAQIQEAYPLSHDTSRSRALLLRGRTAAAQTPSLTSTSAQLPLRLLAQKRRVRISADCEQRSVLVDRPDRHFEWDLMGRDDLPAWFLRPNDLHRHALERTDQFLLLHHVSIDRLPRAPQQIVEALGIVPRDGHSRLGWDTSPSPPAGGAKRGRVMLPLFRSIDDADGGCVCSVK